MESYLFEQIYKLGIIPVIQIDSVDRAVPLANALAAGGVSIVEITLRTEAALGSIRNITLNLPHILIGAGTVLNRKQAQAACDAGAKFLVSPGLDEKLVTFAQKKQIPISLVQLPPPRSCGRSAWG